MVRKMVDKGKIKKWVKQDLIVKDLFREKDLSFDSILDSVTTEVVVNRAIDLAIEKTLREANAEKEILRQKLIEDFVGAIIWLNENYSAGWEESHLQYIKIKFEGIINKRFGVKE